MRVKLTAVLVAISLMAVFAPDSQATMSVYFNTPPTSNSIDTRVVAVISAATSYCYVAIYALNQPSIVNALISAKGRGVDVRVVTETDYRWKAGYQASYDSLVAAGIPVVEDNRSALMHNKFIVADGTKVVTGSYNFSTDQTTADKNNIIIFSGSATLATMYKNEFLQMYAGTFGASKVDYSGSTTVDGSTVYVYFSPKAAVRTAVNSHIASANTSIYFDIFTFTDTSIQDALIARKNAGVTVQGAFDSWQAGSTYTTMKSAGCAVRKDAYAGLLHDKYMAIDGGTTSSPRTITGSFNWTASADDDNDENCVTILNSTVTSSYKTNAIYVYTYKSTY
jgi:phosphatidylserine/phosphatidylglycerophosphate/cardiolipin synthase-like enzyme